MTELNVDLVAADRKIWSGAAHMVSAPAADGEIGVLAGHQPLLSVLREGSVRIKASAGSPVEIEISGGFISVDSNHVTVVVDAVLTPASAS